MALTGAQILMQQGESRGEAGGEVNARRTLVSRRLERKFGSLPPERRAQIAKAESAGLDRWPEALLFTESLDTVFEA